MKLRIAYITDERYPSHHTDTQQVVKTAEALATCGCEVDLILPRMARHLATSSARVKEQICRYYNVEGRFNVRTLLSWPASDLRIEKFFHAVWAPLWAQFKTYDVVYTRNLIPLRLCLALGLPTLFETYRALPMSNPRAWTQVLRSAARPSFIGLSTHSEYAREVMLGAGFPKDKIQAIPNGFDPQDFSSIASQKEIREQYQLPLHTPIAVYTGHIRADKGIDALLEMAADCPEVLFLLVGGSPSDVDSLEGEIDKRQLTNIRLTGHVPIAEVPSYLMAGDVLVLPPSGKPLFGAGRTVLPMKTFTYLAARRPILAPDLPDTGDVLLHDVNCFKVPPGDRLAAAAALRTLLEDATLAARLARRAQADSTQFTWEERGKRLVQFMEKRLAASD